MSRFSPPAVRDEFGRPIPGVLVYVYDWDFPSDSTGELSELVDDDGVTALPNPLTTDQFGAYYFNAPQGEKLIELHYGGKLQWREQIILAPDGSEPLGLIPGSADRSGKYLAFDALGNAVASSGTGADAGLRTDLAASTGSTLAGFAPSWSGAVTRTVQDKLRDLPHLYDIIAPANRTTSYDATTALNSALATGERFVLPKSEVRFAGTLQAAASNGGLIGQGGLLTHTSATGDLLQLGDGTNEITGLRFSNFRLWSTVSKTAGFAVNGRFVSYAEFDSVSAGTIRDYSAAGSSHRLFKGFCFNGFAQCSVDGGEIVTSSDCVTINGKTGQTWGYELSFGGGMRLFASNGKAFYLGGSAGGVHLGRLDVSTCRYAVYCDSLISGETNRELFIHSDCSLDTCGAGINVQATGLSLLEAPGAWVAGCGQSTTDPAILIAAGAGTDLRAPGIRVYGNYNTGIEINDGFADLSGAWIRLNGRNAGGGYGVKARSGIDDLVLSGAIINSNGNGTVGRAVYVESGVTNYTIANNDVSGNGQTPGLEFQGGLTLSTSKSVRNNRGYVTERQGQSTITAGQTSVTVTHGMDTAPQYPVIVGIGHQIHACVQNLSSTTFQIVIGATQGSDIAFQWSMRAES